MTTTPGTTIVDLAPRDAGDPAAFVARPCEKLCQAVLRRIRGVAWRVLDLGTTFEVLED